jgi:hypothetical protein
MRCMEASFIGAQTVVIREKSSRKFVIRPTVPGTAGCWPHGVPIVRKCKQNLDSILISGRHQFVESL